MSSSTTFSLYFLLLFFPFLSFFFLLSSHFSPRFVVYFFPQSSFRHRLRRLSARERETRTFRRGSTRANETSVALRSSSRSAKIDFWSRFIAREIYDRRSLVTIFTDVRDTRNCHARVQSLVLERRIPTTDFAVESRFAVDSADRAQTCRRRIFFFLFFPTERCCVRVVRVALAYVYVNG